jgi:hypothetical protein
MGISFGKAAVGYARSKPRPATPSERVGICSDERCKDRTKICRLFDADSGDDRYRMAALARIFVAASLSVYLVARYGMQLANERFQTIVRIEFRGNARAPAPQKLLMTCSPHKPTIQKRMAEFPQSLTHLTKQSLNMARALAIMQLHPAEDDPAKLAEFAAEYPDHTTRGFVRIMFVTGSLRHLGCLGYFHSSKNPLESLADIEHVKCHLRVDLTKIEKHLNYRRCPRIRISWCRGLWKYSARTHSKLWRINSRKRPLTKRLSS